jgi:7,8-dihydropterin-6-yl-methyl-4-(beta-D-ribofuranosyl)aminobenzene 5'-phosphate synthase
VHPLGTPLVGQAVLGSPNWPWRPINEQDARTVIQGVRARGAGLVALSGHDNTAWTIDTFGQVFGDRYRTVRVGEEIVIPAS